MDALSGRITQQEAYMSTKREIIIKFVTTSPGAKVSSIVDALSDFADELTITCKVLGRTTERKAAKEKAIVNPGKVAEAIENDEAVSHRPQLVYTSDPEAKHNRYIDIEASLKKLNLTREQLMARTWTRGSPQHRLKRAASHKRHPSALAAVSNGAST
jgi:hypothetical protein